EPDGRVRLAVDRPADVEDIFQQFELDRAIDAQVGPRTAGQGTLEFYIHGHGAVQYRWIDAGHHALDQAVARVDDRLLADLHIAGLGFGDLDLGLELRRLHDLGERRARA